MSIDEHTTSVNIMHKVYDGESIVDMGRDVSEAIDGEYNDIIDQIPTDEHGFMRGRIRVTIEWLDDPKCCCCGTRENLHKDGWYGYRCNSIDCVPF
jgi:hypothetical protein